MSWYVVKVPRVDAKGEEQEPGYVQALWGQYGREWRQAPQFAFEIGDAFRFQDRTAAEVVAAMVGGYVLGPFPGEGPPRA